MNEFRWWQVVVAILVALLLSATFGIPMLVTLFIAGTAHAFFLLGSSRAHWWGRRTLLLVAVYCGFPLFIVAVGSVLPVTTIAAARRALWLDREAGEIINPLGNMQQEELRAAREWLDERHRNELSKDLLTILTRDDVTLEEQIELLKQRADAGQKSLAAIEDIEMKDPRWRRFRDTLSDWSWGDKDCTTEWPNLSRGVVVRDLKPCQRVCFNSWHRYSGDGRPFTIIHMRSGQRYEVGPEGGVDLSNTEPSSNCYEGGNMGNHITFATRNAEG